MLQSFILSNHAASMQEACTKTSYAVDEVLEGVKREQIISLQTQVLTYTFDGIPGFMCVVTLVLDLLPEQEKE